MKLKTLMVINTVVAGIFGLAFILVPWEVLSLYGTEPDPAVNYVGQLFGTGLLAISILTWFARNVTDSLARGAIVLALFVSDGIGLIASLIAQAENVINTLGWLTVAIYLFFTIGYGYFRFAKSA